MKVNRKITAVLGIIGAMVLYLIMSKITWCSDIPSFKTWEGHLDEISIKGPVGAVVLKQKGGQWLIGDKGWPADPNALKELERRLKELRITDLVSRGGHYERYDLVPGKAIEIVALKDGKQVRRLLVGKKSAAGHNYVRLDDRPGVYLAEGGTDTLVSRGPDEFRDREILRLSHEAITAFEIRTPGRVLSFTRLEETKPADGGGTGDQKKAIEDLVKNTAPKTYRWVSAGTELDAAKINTFLWSFNPLTALAFVDMKKDLAGPPSGQVVIKAFNKEITVTVHGKKDRDYLVTTSESPFVFTLDEWRAKRYFITSLDEFKTAK